MKSEIMKKILKGKKTTLRVDGVTFFVVIDKDERDVYLVPRGNWGGEVGSNTDPNSDVYKYGGNIFRHALEIAWEIRDALPKEEVK